MRVTCPQCAAAYDVPERLLAAGPKALRCKQCGATFPAALPTPSAIAPEPDLAAAALSPLAPPDAVVPAPLVPTPLVPAMVTPADVVPADVVRTDVVQAEVAAPSMLDLPSASAPVSVVFHPPLLTPPRARTRTVGTVWGVAGWIATLVILVGVGIVLARDADRVIAAWPPAARAYAALGLSPAAAPTPPGPQPAPAATPPAAQPPAAPQASRPP